jgi:CheY-like chemotaxis protein
MRERPMNATGAETRPRGPVLVVEDDASLLDSIAEVLEMEGYEVESSLDGKEALELLQQGTVPCLIILDLIMPVMDGWGFRREQRSDPALSGIPVLVISGGWALASQSDILEADDYLVKPFTIEALLVTVERLCVEADSRAAPGSATESASALPLSWHNGSGSTA